MLKRIVNRKLSLVTKLFILFFSSAQYFPTPMEEPKKVLKVYYLGSTNVGRATGVETLNSAIEKLSSAIPKSEYKYVNVAVAPSTITISEPTVSLCCMQFSTF